jgi:hypothetical protein
MTTTVSVVTLTGAREDRPALLVSPSGTFAAVDLRGSDLKGTVDVFHVHTGLRATPPRHFSKVGNQKTAKALAAWLDELDPVEDDGTLKIERDEYHRAFGEWIKENT